MFSCHLSSTQHQLPQRVGDWALGTTDFSLFTYLCTQSLCAVHKEKAGLVEIFLDIVLPDWALSWQIHIKHTPLTSLGQDLCSSRELRIKSVKEELLPLLWQLWSTPQFFSPVQDCCQKSEVCPEGPAHTGISLCWAPSNERLEHSPLCASTRATTQGIWMLAHTYTQVTGICPAQCMIQ